jgi:hypothetical protein
MGDKFDEKATKTMDAGAYGYWAAGMKHFGLGERQNDPSVSRVRAVVDPVC